MGRSTLLHELLLHLRNVGRAARLFQSSCNSREILEFLLTGMGVDPVEMESAVMQSKLSGIWFSEMLQGKRFVLLFDDADQLDDDTLETLRLLSKFETSNTKFLQIVLCGPPKLSPILDRENLSRLCAKVSTKSSPWSLCPP